VPTRPPLRLLHTSDVHLGAFEGAPERRERHHAAFSRVVDAAESLRVDALLIAGDFFDHARVAEETLRFAATEIARAGVPVVLGPGNHDHVGPGSVYDRDDWDAYPRNLHVLRSAEGEAVVLEQLELEVWARGHTEQDPGFAPMQGVPRRGEASWQVAIAHGHYVHPRSAPYRSFQISREQIRDSDRDYVALGHWDRLVRVDGGHVTAAYSGAPGAVEGHPGLGGHSLLVELRAGGEVRLRAEHLEGGPALEHDELPRLA
jgi:DNA repair exonuclease SbcCD nuclease subunit